MPLTIRTLLQFAFFLSILASTAAVHACGQGGATCSSSGEPAAQPSNVVQVGAGNPINVITGNKYQREVDMPALPGVLGLEIVRHYNSSLSRPQTRPGALGRGWHLSYESSLYLTATGITVDQADGSQVMFGQDLVNKNVLLPRDPAQGRMEIVRTRRGDEYLWTWADGRKLRFNVMGKLDQIEAPTGEVLTMQYDPRGFLLRVTDPQGRSLQLHWLDSETAKRADRFRGVQTIDSPVGRFSYGYGSERPKGATVAPTGLLANLVKVSYPTAGQGRRYHYESALHPTLMTGISIDGLDAKGKPTSMRYATFGYGADGRANLSTHANDVDKVTLDYTSPETTTITNSLGQKTTYRFRSFYNEDRLLEVRGAGCSLCGEPNLRYGYDKLGRLTEVTKLSVQGDPLQTIRTTLDHYGRPVTVAVIAHVNGKATAEQRLARYEYGAGTTGNPTLIARPSVVPGQETITRITYNQTGQPLSVTESGWAPAIDGKGRATPIERTARYAYARINGRNLLTQIDGPLANGPTNSPADSDITRIDWDARGNYVVAATTPGGFSNQFAYDQANRLVSVKNSDGQETTLRYIGVSQLAAVTQDGVTRRYRYDAMGRLEEVGVDAGQGYRALAHFGFDEANRRVMDAAYVGILTSRRFDTEGKLLGVTTLSSRSRQERTYAYDAAGRLVASTDANGGTQTLHWNAQGLPDAVTDALGRAQHFRYDALGRLDEVTGPANPLDTAQPAGARTRFEQDAHGNTVTVVAPSGAVTQTFTDDFGQVVAVRSADAGLITRTYDIAGRLVASSDANGNTARYAYDVLGRIVRQTVTDAHAIDARKRDTVTVWTYAGKRLVAIDHPDQSERYAYDGQGKLASKTVTLTLADGTHATTVTRYRYDQQGQLVAASLPDGSTLHYRRNGQHQIVSIERSRIETGWLAWLLPAQTVVKDLQRDLIGLRRIVFGNGIETRYERSAEGALARIVVRRADEQEPHPTRYAALDALGVATAKAATAVSSAKTGDGQPAGAPARPAPGALAVPQDPAALVDHRYLWDVQGNLLYTQSRDRISHYAYDANDRLIAAGTVPATTSAHGVAVAATADKNGLTSGTAAGEGASFSRYFYDSTGNRVLAQEAVSNQEDTSSHTIKTHYAPGSNRWQESTAANDAAQPADIRYDASGQPRQIGEREYVWNALGKLVEVREQKRALASYRYNNSGLRISKTVGGHTTYYLYENRQLSAELNEQGRVTRQYIYVAEQPVAIIDTPQGAETATQDSAAMLAQVGHDLATVVKSWLSAPAQIAYLHTNHLGAAELVTDTNGNAVWRAEYQPYGKLVAVSTADRSQAVSGQQVSSATAAFRLNLRLPGQYEDDETGLYYNDHRYYDPARGQYLTPDPLGLGGGINSYAYVSGNPLKYIDPTGLILFAFDGTGNTNNLAELDGGSVSNVWKFYQAYDSGNRNYVTGVGTTHHDAKYGDIVPATFANGTLIDRITGSMPLNYVDQAGNYSGPARIERMMLYLKDEAEAMTDPNAVMDIDIVGFSRGAAEARDFANRIASHTTMIAGTNTGWYSYKDGDGKSVCQKVNFRFMGLFDTVLSTNRSGTDYNLAIPPAFAYVSQAVALNEYRSSNMLNAPSRNPLPWRQHFGGFPLESIGASSDKPGQIRVERGFLGAHADIGGGYGANENQLSLVALNWIVEQAKAAGVHMSAVEAIPTTDPVLHDKSNAIRMGNPTLTNVMQDMPDGNSVPLWAEDRDVHGAVSGTTQRRMGFNNDSMTNADTHQFINYKPRDINAPAGSSLDPKTLGQNTGTVNINAYMAWLKQHHYWDTAATTP